VANTAAISNIRDVAAPFLQSPTDFLNNLELFFPWEKFTRAHNDGIASLVVIYSYNFAIIFRCIINDCLNYSHFSKTFST